HGILTQFEQLHAVDEYVFYRAVLVPKLWWLSLTHHNQVFLNKTVPEIIQEVLEDGGLTTLDIELRLENGYPQWEYICQYRESHFSFVSRWMEREGMYYFFEQTDTGEKMIITDTKVSHTDMPQGKTMHYSPPSGLDELHREEVIKAFICRQTMIPHTLRLKDYNYRTPSLEMNGQADVAAHGRGEVFIYGEHFRTPEEGDTLAKVRAEELLCQEKRFYGESTIPYLRPGYLFDFQDHYRDSFNQTYLTVELEHEGSQAAFLLAGVQKGLSEVEDQPYYRNSFVDIPGDVQFRPERKTEKARFYGAMNAKIDAAESGRYAELDDQGRYKVVLPFDISGRKDGKASTYLRMAQPYAGTDHGMHFPLHKGTEVLLTFIDGDPDRPIIAGAVPNQEYPSQVTSEDQTMSKITTSGGNKIHMEDQEGKQRILLHTPTAGTFLRLGSPNDPDDEFFYPHPVRPSSGITPSKLSSNNDPFSHEEKEEMEKGKGEWGINLVSEKGIHVQAGGKNEVILGEETVTIAGAHMKTVGGVAVDIVVGEEFKLNVLLDQAVSLLDHLSFVLGAEQHFVLGSSLHIIHPSDVHISPAHTEMHGEINEIHGSVTELAGETTKLAGETTKLAGEVTNLSGEVTDLAENTNTLATNQTKIIANATSLGPMRQHIYGQLARVVAENTEAIAEQTAAIGEHTETIGEKIVISGSVDEIVGFKVTV
ncbi:MAG: type VI secretion system tip protein TssI/VgrG, partial [Pseudomonadota bacterium]